MIYFCNMNRLKVYIAGKVSPTSVFGTHDWREGLCSRLMELTGIEFVNLDPTKSYLGFDLNEKDSRLIFGRDCFMIRESDLVIVNLTDDISVGGSQEMLIAKYYGRPLVGIAPWGGKFRQREKEILGKTYQDYTNPFVGVPCDAVVADMEELAQWIQDEFPRCSATSLSILDDCLDYYVNQHARRDSYVRERVCATADESIKGREGFGLVQVFTGNGKGKTTAAIGEVMRCVGAGKRAAVIFFDKGGTHCSERSMLEQLGVPWFAYGRDRIDPVTGRFDFSITEEDRRLGQEGLIKAQALVESDQYDLLILDEINSSTDLRIVDEREVLSLIDQKPDHVELVLTGRNAPQSFIDRAHLVTEMRLRKHYFYSGVKAREGLDF